MAREGALLAYGVVACVAGALVLAAGSSTDAVALAIGRGYGLAQLASGVASLVLWARRYRPANGNLLSVGTGVLLASVVAAVVVARPGLALTAASVAVAVALVLGAGAVARVMPEDVRVPAGNGLRRTRSI